VTVTRLPGAIGFSVRIAREPVNDPASLVVPADVIQTR
jgi:hypothetical protein